MLEVILDASQLETVEPCPYKWYLSYIRSLETRRPNPALSTGSWYHEALKYYYKCGQPLSEYIRATLLYAKELALGPLCVKWPEVAKEPKFHLERLQSYLINWLHEDEAMEIIGVEQGFSWLLYEDNTRRYILEGQIDLVSKKRSTGLTVTDHKTQSRVYEKYPYNHQVMNYVGFTGANYFEYDYIGLQQKVGDNTFSRPIFKVPDGMIEQWKRDILETFNMVAWYLENEKFPRRRSACHTQFGTCQYHKICQVPDDNLLQVATFSAFKEKDEKWRAWS